MEKLVKVFKNCCDICIFHHLEQFKEKVKSLSHVWLFVTPWTVAFQAPLSMGLSRQEYWSGLPFPSPGDLPNPGIEPRSPELQADFLLSAPPGKSTKEERIKSVELNTEGDDINWD